MFGFIKMVEQFIRNLRNNKRLWFTTIFIIATSGVILATYLLITTTNRVSNNVYITQTKDYELRLKSLERLVENKLHQIAIAFVQNQTFIDAIKENDIQKMQEIEDKFNSEIGTEDRNTLSINAYSVLNTTEIQHNSIVASIQTKNNIFGIRVFYDGVFYVFLLPVVEDDKTIGVIEVRQSIYSLKDSFNALEQEHIFMLDSKMLPLLSIEKRDEMSLPIGKNYFINNKKYNSETLGYIESINNKDIEKILAGDYIVTKDIYLNGVVVRDINGVNIGLIVMGQSANHEGSFIDMADKMTNQVIMIALGLIVSLLLFLF